VAGTLWRDRWHSRYRSGLSDAGGVDPAGGQVARAEPRLPGDRLRQRDRHAPEQGGARTPAGSVQARRRRAPDATPDAAGAEARRKSQGRADLYPADARIPPAVAGRSTAAG